MCLVSLCRAVDQFITGSRRRYSFIRSISPLLINNWSLGIRKFSPWCVHLCNVDPSLTRVLLWGVGCVMIICHHGAQLSQRLRCMRRWYMGTFIRWYTLTFIWRSPFSAILFQTSSLSTSLPLPLSLCLSLSNHKSQSFSLSQLRNQWSSF